MRPTPERVEEIRTTAWNGVFAVIVRDLLAEIDALRQANELLIEGNRVERDALAARVRELEAALRPFAMWADSYPGKWGDACAPRVYISDAEDEIMTHVTLGDLRRARAALAPTQRDP